LENGLLK